MNIKDKPLSGYDLIRMMKDLDERGNIIQDTDIKASDNIEDIFHDKGHALIFHPWPGQKIGHWVCMIRNKELNQVYYYDSFGKNPYNKNIITVVLKTYPELLVNDIQFQNNNSNCCGRQCLLVCALNKLGLSPEQIEEFLKTFDVDKFVIDTIQE
jgi:hypothetical protein